MTPEIKSFSQLMVGNRMADAFSSQALTAMNADLEQAFTGMLRTHLLRYVELPIMRKQIDSSEDFNVQLKAVLGFFPSFLFVLAGELATLPGADVSARRLVIAAIFFVIERTSSHQQHIQLFIEGLQQKEKLQLFAEGDVDPETMVLPEVVFTDYMLLAEHPIQFQPTRNTPEMIENLFCLSGISHIFLKYYFDLLTEAKDAGFSQKINMIFSRLFIGLRLEEIRYWKGYQNSAVIKKRLHQIIEANSPKMRHSKLQKNIFGSLANYNPIIHNGTSRGMTVTTQSVLKTQLGAFLSFSVAQMTLLMNIVHRFKGNDYVVYLISQIIKNDKQQLKELDAYLGRLQQKSLQDLQALVGSLVKRFFPEKKSSAEVLGKAGSSIQYRSESARLAQAKKNIEALGDRKGMMTHDKVAKYLEDRLKKLFEKVKMSGALTADMVPKYLEQFADAAQKVLVEVNPARQKELVEAFEESTDDILNEITRFSEMSSDEVESIRSDIHTKVIELDTPDLDKRTEVVEQIGMALSDVSEAVNPSPPAPDPQPIPEAPPAGIDVAAILAREEISIGFDDKAPLMPLGEFFKLPFGERKGPPEDDWFVYHKQYLELAVENKKLKPSILEAFPDIEAQLPKLKYRKYFNIFSNGEYQDPTCSAVFDIWKSSALEKLLVG